MNRLELKKKLEEINQNLKIDKTDVNLVKIYKQEDEEITYLLTISEILENNIVIEENLLESAKNKWIDTEQFGELFKAVIDYAGTEIRYRDNPNLIRNKITGEFLRQIKDNERGWYYTHTNNSNDSGTLLYEVELKDNGFDLSGYDVLDSDTKEQFFESNNKPLEIDSGDTIDL